MTKSAFDLDRFIADCSEALRQAPCQKAMRQIMERALADPKAVRDRLGEPRRAQIEQLFVSPDLVILNVVWAPGMIARPHNHNMRAILGVYGGREDNIFWRRIKNDAGGKIEAAGAKALSSGECATLGRDIIHSVTNPSAQFSGALHIYGGDFFGVPRSEWDSDTLLEGSFSAARTMQMFEEANERYARLEGHSTTF